jgi:competence protein ComEA
MHRLSLVPGIVVAALLALSPPVAAQEKASEKPKASASSSSSAPLDLNTATAAQLEKLPGVGAKTAQLIVEHRQKNGNFKKVEELMNIKGIGEKSFLKIKPLVTVGTGKGAGENP